MPTYEYECTKCGGKFELFQSMSEPAKKRVKAEVKGCGCDAPVSRCIGIGAGVIFKGSGFYQTDYRSESYKQAAEADKKSSEAKPAAEAKGGDSKSSGDAKGSGDAKSSTDAKGSDSGSAPADSKATGKTTSAPARATPKKKPAGKKKG